MVMAEYRFIEKHPIVDILRTAIFEDKRTLVSIIADTNGAVTAATVRKWLYGETKRPQYYKIAAVLEAVGVEIRHVWKSTGEQVRIQPQLDRKHFVGQRREARKKVAGIPRRWSQPSVKEQSA